MKDISCGKTHNFHVYFKCYSCGIEKEFYILDRQCKATQKSATQPGNLENKNFKCKNCNDQRYFPMMLYCNPGSRDENSLFYDKRVIIKIINIDNKV